MSDTQSARQTPLANDSVGSLVGEFMEEKKKEQQDDKARRQARKRHPLVLPVLLLLLGGIAAAPLLAPEPEAVAEETLAQGARVTLYLASLRVREYMKSNRRLPASLTDAGVVTPGLEYTRSSATAFELSTQFLGSKLVYRSTQPDSLFLGPNLRIRGIS
jgi:hypothetical protein